MNVRTTVRLLALLLPALVGASPGMASWTSDPRVNLAVCTATGSQGVPQIVSDDAGRAIITWADDRNGNSDIYAHRVLSSGVVDPSWPANGQAICSAAGSQQVPSIIAVADGAIIAWIDRRSGGYDIYAQHILANGTVDPAWPPDGRFVANAAATSYDPSSRVLLAPDLQGGAVLAWTDFRNGNDFNVNAQHVLVAGSLDSTWPVGGLQVCGLGADQIGRSIVSDGNGGAFVSWDDRRSNISYDIYVHHVLSNGTVDPVWPVAGTASCDAAGNQDRGYLVRDGDDGVIVAWTDRRAGNQDIYVQRVLGGGTVDPAWPTNGRALCTATGDQSLGGLIANGSGGAIATWMDGRSGSQDIYAHQVLASGGADPAWPADGRAVNATTSNQSSPVIVEDGNGGAIIAWLDQRFVPEAILAHHVFANGALDPVWPTDGRVLSNANGFKQAPQIVPDGDGGAIAAWSSLRTAGNSDDIFAQRVGPNGQLGGDVTSVGHEGSGDLQLRLRCPNPIGNGDLTLGFWLSGAESASMGIHDLTGRRLAFRDLSRLGNGRQQVTFREARELRTGVYFVQLRQGQRTAEARFVVLR